jgi:NADH dehydrogenase FAD-containing subunit
MAEPNDTRILILGGGFGGLYVALELEKTLAGDPNVNIALVNRENFFLFTPMLHEVAASDLDLTSIVNPARKLSRKKFSFATIGQLAAIGRRSGVANILGFNFSGFVAWWLWRSIYLSKLPRMEKKVRVALDWTLDLMFSKDLVQYQTFRAPSVSEEEMTQHDETSGDKAA